MPVTNIVRETAAKYFGAGHAPEIIAALDKADFPLVKNADRVQLAILILSEGRFEDFRYALSQAEGDWRDTLVAAGMAHADWPEVLRSHGIPWPLN